MRFFSLSPRRNPTFRAIPLSEKALTTAYCIRSRFASQSMLPTSSPSLGPRLLLKVISFYIAVSLKCEFELSSLSSVQLSDRESRMSASLSRRSRVVKQRTPDHAFEHLIRPIRLRLLCPGVVVAAVSFRVKVVVGDVEATRCG